MSSHREARSCNNVIGVPCIGSDNGAVRVAAARPPASRVPGAPAVVLGAVVAACAGRPPAPVVSTAAEPPPGQLRSPAQFAAIVDRAARSRALFSEASRVLTHPRCVNCHPPDETPRQGDDHALHDPPVLRGAEDRGIPALGCETCHQDRNAELARVPGAPSWHLAPATMAWLDKSPAAICTQIKDPARNGHRTLPMIQDHMAHDALVGWAWQPGAHRAPAPGSQAELGALVQAWIDTGAECPQEVPR